MNLYAVFQEGVYRHACCGIFDSLEKATYEADSCAASVDDDGYHSYEVVPFVLNDTCEGGVLYRAQGPRRRV